MTPPVIQQADRQLTSTYAPDDVGATLAYYGDPEVSRYLLSEPFTLNDAREAVDGRRSHTDPTEVGESLALAVAHEGQLVGDVTLKLVGEKSSIGEIG